MLELGGGYNNYHVFALPYVIFFDISGREVLVDDHAIIWLYFETDLEK